MLKRLGFRLGFILCMSVMVRVVGLFSPHQPKLTGQMISDRTHGTIASKIAEEGDPARGAILGFTKRGGN